MLPKKSPQADLTNKRFLFFEIGLLIALLLVVWVFHYGTGSRPHPPAAYSSLVPNVDDEEWHDFPSFEVITKSLRQPIQKPIESESIEIVENTPRTEVEEFEPEKAETEGRESVKNIIGENNVSFGDLSGSGLAKSENAKGAIDEVIPRKPVREKPDKKRISYYTRRYIPPNTPGTVSCIILMPYIPGQQYDKDKFEKYVSTILSVVNNSLPNKFKPLVIVFPLNAFLVNPSESIPDSNTHTDRVGDKLPRVRNLLMANEWKTTINGDTFFLRYKDQQEIRTIDFTPEYANTIQTFRKYYLSNTPELRFDESRVGSKQSGRYIILETHTKLSEVVEILDINDNIMVTRLYPDRVPLRYRAVRQPKK